MTATQIGINDQALRNAAEKVAAIGYDGDAYRFCEGLVVSVLADGYRRLEKPPALHGPGASRQAIEDAIEKTEAAVRASKDRRKTTSNAHEEKS
jgi:hypothetical protein